MISKNSSPKSSPLLSHSSLSTSLVQLSFLSGRPKSYNQGVSVLAFSIESSLLLEIFQSRTREPTYGQNISICCQATVLVDNSSAFASQAAPMTPLRYSCCVVHGYEDDTTGDSPAQGFSHKTLLVTIFEINAPHFLP
ncbi:hypothetical protein VNO77_13888 [Canavalia gladiata]|uniref:Uncharacterized protein n=1 Tax=Canavalia gladiata TaxID=3824 RepID=A0AAN9LXQ0_CANGL